MTRFTHGFLSLLPLPPLMMDSSNQMMDVGHLQQDGCDVNLWSRDLIVDGLFSQGMRTVSLEMKDRVRLSKNVLNF